MKTSISDTLRFAAIERVIVDTIKDLPDGWDYIMYMGLIKAEHELVEELRAQIDNLQDTVAELEYEEDSRDEYVAELEYRIRQANKQIKELTSTLNDQTHD